MTSSQSIQLFESTRVHSHWDAALVQAIYADANVWFTQTMIASPMGEDTKRMP